MKKIDTIVVAPHFYTMEGAGVGYHSDAAMAVDGGKILKVGNRPEILAEYTAEEMITLDHHMVLPGFIDGHMHTACNIMRGLAQDTNSWMMFGLQPFDNAVNDEERDAGSRVAILEAVRAGTTTLGDYDSKMENVCAFIDKVGARGNIAQTIRAAKRRVYQPGELYEFDDAMGEESLNRNIDLYNKWNNKAGGRIKILFGPQGADFVSPEMLLRIQKAVKERGTKIHMHVQQGDRETYQIVQRYGKRPTAFLDELGYLDESLIAVHLTDCTDEEAALIAKRGASMIVNPGSIGIIDGIVCQSQDFILVTGEGYTGIPCKIFPGILVIQRQLNTGVTYGTSLDIHSRPTADRQLRVECLVHSLGIVICHVQFKVLEETHVQTDFPRIGTFRFQIVQRILGRDTPLAGT